MMRRSIHAEARGARRPRVAQCVLLAGGWMWAVLPLTGCGPAGGAGREASRGVRHETVPVRVATVQTRAAPRVLRGIGTVEPLARVTIRPQVDGRLLRVHFADGQDVAAGDVLFEIDSRPCEAALALARANLARDQAWAADAQREAQRVGELFRGGSAADRERDQAQADADAKAAQARADEAAVEQAALELSYCTIRAPFDGRAGARLADPGSVVKQNETDLVVLNQVREVYVTFSLAEQHLAAIRRHATDAPLDVEARIPGVVAPPARGTLTFIDNEVDRTTGMIRLRGTFANGDGLLWPGQQVDAGLVLAERPEATVVPTRAVQAGPAGQFVFVVDAQRKVSMRPVKLDDALDDLSVVQSGLSPGEIVVTDGHLRLTPDAEVTFTEDAAATSQPATAPAAPPDALAVVGGGA